MQLIMLCKKEFSQVKEINMLNLFINQSPLKTAKIAGLLYLIFIITFATSTFINPIVSEDVTGIAKNIMAHVWLFKLGIIIELISAVFFLLAAWALYVLLRQVNKNIALLFLLILLVGVAMECINTANHFAAYLILNDKSLFKVFKVDQVQSLAMILLNIGYTGGAITGLFYGIWLFPLGYLVYKSNFLPKFLGILLICDGISMLLCFIQHFLLPDYIKWTYLLYPIMFIAEFGLALWLLIKGIKYNENKII